MAKTGPKPWAHVGHKFITNSGWHGQIVEYHDAHNVRVLWQDGSYSTHTASNIKRGGIKPLYQPHVEGVGFFGYGKYVPDSYKRLEPWQVPVDQKIYRHWVKLLDRLFEKDYSRTSVRGYRDCTLDSKWLNFQNFAAWAERQPYLHEPDACLDKDLLVTGNKHYSPETCCFLPNIINVFISSSYNKVSGLPDGVNVIHPKTKNSKVGYVARCHFLGKREYLGYFDSPEEAGEVFYKRKIEAGECLANLYKGKIREEARLKLIDYFRR